MSIPRTTHQWLQPLYDMLEGKKNRILQLGSPTGLFGMFGATGSTRLPTGIMGSTAGVTGLSGFDLRSNGGTGGAFLGLQDVVEILKRHGLAPR